LQAGDSLISSDPASLREAFAVALHQRGEIDEAAIARAIREGGRDLVGPTAPSHGLTLKSVKYD